MKRGKLKTSLKNSKQIKIIIGVFALVLISAFFVYASGLILGGKAFVVSKSSSTDVSAYGDCVKVTNNLVWDLFIPLNTSAEWNSFKNAILPSGLTKGACTPSCVPTTCVDEGISCGTIFDGCGENLDCGACNSGYNCVSGQCICTPKCDFYGYECGPDGCGGSCGECTVGMCTLAQTCQVNCVINGICNVQLEGCSCPDCVEDPECAEICDYDGWCDRSRGELCSNCEDCC